MICPICETENPSGQKFCGECGGRLLCRCPKCGIDNPAPSKFCGHCGTAIALPPNTNVTLAGASSITGAQLFEPRIPFTSLGPQPRIPQGERKTITSLSADITGSMSLLEDLDPDEGRRLLDPVLQIMIDAVDVYGGYVVQLTGDGIFAVFGAPVARERHALHALHAALKMQRRTSDYSRALAGNGGPLIQIRIGVNTGEAVVRSIQTGATRAEYSPIGHSSGVAARMQSVAPPGSVMVTEQTYKIADGYFRFKPFGQVSAKGVRRPLNAYELIGAGSTRTRLEAAMRRGLSRFVGRDQERELLRHALELARQGQGQVVAATGEAGVGKSRLAYELKRECAPSGALILEAACSSVTQQAPYLPLVDLLKGYFHIQPEDSEDRRHEKVTAKLRSLDQAAEESLPFLLSLLDIQGTGDALANMDARMRHQRTLETVVGLLLRESLNQPLFLIFEDLHWIDPETQSFLDLMVPRIATAPILMLVNYRLEYRHEWSQHSHYAEVVLNPLGAESAEEMLAAMLGSGSRIDPIKRLIIEKAACNPFFMEEMAGDLFDQGVLLRGRAIEVTQPVSQIRVPATVQELLASRIDRLPPHEKGLLQLLSVIGPEFPIRLAERVAGHIGAEFAGTESTGIGDAAIDPEHLAGMLQDLQVRGFIYDREGPDPACAFKHVLTQEVAYASLLSERRSLLHEQTGDAIEELYASHLADYYAELAHHYRLAGVIDKAVKYLRLAGQQAVSRSAYNHALSLLKTGLELVKKMAEGRDRAVQEAQLRLALYVPLAACKGMAAPEIEELNSRTSAISAEAGDQRLVFSAQVEAWGLNLVRARFERAREISAHLLHTAESMSQQARMQANLAVGMTSFYLGEFPDACEHLEKAVSLHDPRRHRTPSFSYLKDRAVAAHTLLSLVLWHLGFPNRAVKMSEEAISIAREINHPYSRAYALSFAAVLRQYRREPDRVLALCEASSAIASEHGFALWQHSATIMRGWSLAEMGDTAAGIATAVTGLDGFTATGTRLFVSYFLSLIGEACLRADDAERALVKLTQGLAHVEETREGFAEAELGRLMAEAMATQGDAAGTDAQKWFDIAIATAQKHSDRSVELRILVAVVRQGKEPWASGARERLKEAYGWFREGFETRDLVDAQALIEGSTT